MYLSPAELRSWIAEVPLAQVEVRPRRGVSREGIAFPMGHELVGSFEGIEVVAAIDRLRADPRYAIRWGFAAVPPVLLLARRRAPGVVRGRGLSTGSRAFDKVFKLTCAAAVAKQVLDRELAERLAVDDSAELDGVMAIGAGDPGVPGFSTYFRIAPGPGPVAASFARTLELRGRIFAASPAG